MIVPNRRESYIQRDTLCQCWLRLCATSQKVAGSIHHVVIRTFDLHNSCVHSMAMGLNQPVTEMSISNISWV